MRNSGRIKYFPPKMMERMTALARSNIGRLLPVGVRRVRRTEEGNDREERDGGQILEK